MANYKIMEIGILYCLWSDVHRSYRVSCLCGALPLFYN